MQRHNASLDEHRQGAGEELPTFNNETIRDVESNDGNKETASSPDETGTDAVPNDYTESGWCSWCFRKSLHGCTRRNTLQRSLYMCMDCHRKTVPCRMCDGFARGHGEWDDELCCKCDGTIDSWEDTSGLREEGWCSWCLRETCHALHITNLVRRNGFVCERCGGHTKKCKECDVAFTRCSTFYDERTCLHCDGTIKTWEDYATNKETVSEQKDRLVLSEKPDPYESFVPPRKHCQAHVLIDGQATFNAMADALEAAQSSIFISFWQLNCKVHLRRDHTPLREEDRFDKIIKRRAEDGVKVYVILWKEMNKYAVDNYSIEAKKYLQSLSPNISVQRHRHPTPFACAWSHHQKFMVVDQTRAIIGGLDVCMGRWDSHAHVCEDPECKQWIGRDYYQPHVPPSSTDIEPWDEDVYDRNSVPRLPWHDVDVEIRGEAARDIARNFVQRWNHHRKLKAVFPLTSHRDKISLSDFPAAEQKEGSCVCQVVRSMDQWSGHTHNERSIYGGYVRAIYAAEHYIYIENQYFATSLAGSGVQNQIGKALLDKLREKIRAKATFRVILILPHPEEPGAASDSLLHWLYLSLSRGGSSLLEQLRGEFPDVDLSEYITVGFLRAHGKLAGEKVVTEMVFVHAKIMLVDDRLAMVGSANLNDRSLMGDRDSEIGVLLEDTDTVDITMDGKAFKAGRLIHNMRVALWQEHLGLSSDEVDSIKDPISSSSYNDVWMKRAKRNTEIYESVFPAIPNNRQKTKKDVKKATNGEQVITAEGDTSLLDGVRGHLTLHPLEFLQDEYLMPVIATMIGEAVTQ